jgi:serine/threonine protein kinase
MAHPTDVSTLLSEIAELESERVADERRISRLEAEISSVTTELRRVAIALSMRAGPLSGNSMNRFLVFPRPAAPPTPFNAPAFLRRYLRPSADFEISPKIGEGRYVRWLLARDRLSQKECLCGQCCWHRFWYTRQIGVPLVVNLPGVLQPSALCIDGLDPFFVTEFFPHGTLAEAARGSQGGHPPLGFGPTQLSKCVFGIAVAMAAFHARGGIHRNLTPDSVFLDSQFEPVLGDLSCSTIVTESSPPLCCDHTPVLYQAPEMLNLDVYDQPVDVYAFGFLLCWLFDCSTWANLCPSRDLSKVVSGGCFAPPISNAGRTMGPRRSMPEGRSAFSPDIF